MPKKIYSILPFLSALLLHLCVFLYFYSNNSSETISLVKLQSIESKHSINIQVSPATKKTSTKKVPSLFEGHTQDQRGQPTTETASIPLIKNNNNEGEIEFIYFENPKYPAMARAQGIEGVINVKIDFNENGLVSKVIITEPLTSKILSNSIISSVNKWKIKSLNKKITLEKTFEFKLNQ